MKLNSFLQSVKGMIIFRHSDIIIQDYTSAFKIKESRQKENPGAGTIYYLIACKSTQYASTTMELHTKLHIWGICIIQKSLQGKLGV